MRIKEHLLRFDWIWVAVLSLIYIGAVTHASLWMIVPFDLAMLSGALELRWKLKDLQEMYETRLEQLRKDKR